jgi:hypothetical protein
LRRWLRFGILPRRLLRCGGASVVAAMVAAQLKEIPMTKAKSKRKPASPLRQDQDPQQRKADDRAQERTTQARYRVSNSSAVRIAAERTSRKQKGSHHCNVASASWRDH